MTHYVDISKTERVKALYGAGEIILVGDGVALRARIDREQLLSLLLADPQLLISGRDIVDMALLKQVARWLNDALRRAEELAKQRDRHDIARWAGEARKLVGWIAALAENPAITQGKTLIVSVKESSTDTTE